MRLPFVVVPFALFGSFIACASSGGSAPAGSGNASGSPDASSSAPGKAEAPLAARSICNTIPVQNDFGRGCSGTSSGARVCALLGDTCSTDLCVYQADHVSYSFTCSAACKVGGSLRCPMSYECVAPNPGCSSVQVGATDPDLPQPDEVPDGVCVKARDFVCDDGDEASSVPNGRFIEGPAGELLVLSVGSGTVKLSVKDESGWRSLVTADDDDSRDDGAGYDGSSYGGTARSGDALLIVASRTTEIIVKDGEATVSTHEKSTDRWVYGSSNDGAFVRLQLDGSTTEGGSYRGLSRRTAEGSWEDLGPTSKRIASMSALRTGYVARCGSSVCTSVDGQTFKTVDLPAITDDVSAQSFSLLAAGASPDDFYVVLDGALIHYRNGEHVIEGPKAPAPGDGGTRRYASYDSLLVSSSGTVVYQVMDDERVSTTYVSGGDCWTLAPSLDLSNSAFVGDVMLYKNWSGALCRQPMK